MPDESYTQGGLFPSDDAPDDPSDAPGRYFKVPNALVDRLAHLTRADLAVYMVLRRKANPGEVTSVGLRWIAKRSEVSSLRAVRESLSQLCNVNVLTIESAAERGRRARYVVHLNPPPLETVAARERLSKGRQDQKCAPTGAQSEPRPLFNCAPVGAQKCAPTGAQGVRPGAHTYKNSLQEPSPTEDSGLRCAAPGAGPASHDATGGRNGRKRERGDIDAESRALGALSRVNPASLPAAPPGWAWLAFDLKQTPPIPPHFDMPGVCSLFRKDGAQLLSCVGVNLFLRISPSMTSHKPTRTLRFCGVEIMGHALVKRVDDRTERDRLAAMLGAMPEIGAA